MTLFEKLQAAGVRTYGDPVWTAGAVIDTITTGDNVVVAASQKYEDTNQLVIAEGNTTMYIPLRTGVDPNRTTFTLQTFTAVRDWEERNIKKGDNRVFAV